ncbi:SCO2322 family protein [Nocardioides speluncae]|uniref:SCO2322 family protein n=1 Tax=Nocardioides speluncae TaxID=2670337 RepID=UPI000D69CCA4|nr:SCO2322 family protein [Nocardioides speluncae]
MARKAFFAALLATLFTICGGLVATSPAEARADIYRYWTYFQVTDGEFVTSTKGVGATVPADGSIEAYRFAAPADFTKPNLPRADLGELTFDTICEHVDAADGKKRVAVIIDYGVPEDAEGGAEPPAPTAACAQADEKATGLQVLSAVAKTRAEEGLLCAIEGYPAAGCSVLVEQATPADPADPVEFELAGHEGDHHEDGGASTDASAEESDEGSNVPLLAAIGAVVLAIIVGGVLLSRRNKTAA